VIEMLRGDISAAVSGVSPSGFPAFQDAWPALRPCGWGADPVSGTPGPCARPDVLSLTLAPRPLEVETTAHMPSSADPLVVSRPQGCPPGATGCEFDAGDLAVVADGHGAVDAFEVRGVSADGTRLEHDALDIAYRAGAAVVAGRVRTYYARDDPATGGLQLRRRDGNADQPVIDHLSGFSVDYAGIAAVPSLAAGPGGVLQASYGPAPVLDPAAPPGVVRYLESCAFDIVDDLPVSTLQGLAPGPDGLAALPLSMFTDGPWCPDAAANHRTDADLYRVARVRLVIRAQSPHAWHRGGAAAFFARAGTSREAGHLVPDVGAAVIVARRGGAR
jgi:hypothetical protein